MDRVVHATMLHFLALCTVLLQCPAAWDSIITQASSVTAEPNMFDVIKYGGVPNEDITQAFANAWKDACASNVTSKVMVPRGTFKLNNAVEFIGPCKAPIEVKVDGTIQAPQKPEDLKGAATWVVFSYLSSFTLSGSGTFDGQGAIAWKQGCGNKKNCKKSMNLAFNFINNSVVRGVTSKDSKNFHVNVLACTNLTFDGFIVSAPGDSLNTDGLYIARSTNVNVINSKISTGDDCISLGDGDRQITVRNVNCGPGHGISVGSLGKFTNEQPVNGLTVRNCTINGTENGVRVKTWPDVPGTIPISNLLYEDITMINVHIPIVIDQEYCPWNECSKKSPSKIKISNVTYRDIRGTSMNKEAVILNCSKEKPCENVQMNNINLTYNGAPSTAGCVNVKPIIVGKAPSCEL